MDGKLPIDLAFRVFLDFTDRARWEPEVARLHDLLQTTAPAPEQIACPYPGMRPFTTTEAKVLPAAGTAFRLLRSLQWTAPCARSHRAHLAARDCSAEAWRSRRRLPRLPCGSACSWRRGCATDLSRRRTTNRARACMCRRRYDYSGNVLSSFRANGRRQGSEGKSCHPCKAPRGRQVDGIRARAGRGRRAQARQ